MVKILAIDDKQDNLITISAILKDILPHCVIITAQSGKEGIRKAQSESPDTILLDIRMPQMDGYEVCAALKSDHKTRPIPIIMLTAHDTDTGSRIRGLELGADAFLTKPIDGAELVAQVKVMLRIKKAEDSLRREKIFLEETVQERTRQLSEKEERYRLLFNKANDAVFVHHFTPSGRPGPFIEVNDVVCQKLGYTREELWRMSPLDIIDIRLQGNERDSTMERLFTEKHVMFETILIAQNGRKLPVEVNTHLFDLQGKPTALSIARDISERKQAELEKDKIQAQLCQAQKMEAIGVLAGGIAHDFNNILTTIQGYASLLMLEIMETDPLYMDLKQICSAACSAANLTRQLLLFSRKQPMSPSPLNINTTIHNLFSMMDRLIGEDITIDLDLEPDLLDSLC
ncbi:MAG: response regulator [bacterium]